MERIGVVYNACYGGFSLSKEGKRRWEEKRRDAGLPCEKDDIYDFEGVPRHRTCPHLVDLVKACPEVMSGRHAQLKVRYLPKEVIDAKAWYIHEYDGDEGVCINRDKLRGYRQDIAVRTILHEILYGQQDPEDIVSRLRSILPEEILDVGNMTPKQLRDRKLFCHIAE